MVTEEDFDTIELAELKRSLTSHGIPFKKSIDDPEMSLQLPNHTVIFFYKNNGQKLYNAGVTPNECNVKYLTQYTPDLNHVIDLIQDHINRKYVTFENRNNNERAPNKILREIEEILNEHGIEAKPHISNVLKLQNNFDITIYNKLGMVEFSMTNMNNFSGYITMANGDKNTLDVLEIIRAYKKCIKSLQPSHS